MPPQHAVDNLSLVDRAEHGLSALMEDLLISQGERVVVVVHSAAWVREGGALGAGPDELMMILPKNGVHVIEGESVPYPMRTNLDPNSMSPSATGRH